MDPGSLRWMLDRLTGNAHANERQCWGGRKALPLACSVAHACPRNGQQQRARDVNIAGSFFLSRLPGQLGADCPIGTMRAGECGTPLSDY
eukprot:1148441-Pelagomonas_calceolata.AAC.5